MYESIPSINFSNICSASQMEFVVLGIDVLFCFLIGNRQSRGTIVTSKVFCSKNESREDSYATPGSYFLGSPNLFQCNLFPHKRASDHSLDKGMLPYSEKNQRERKSVLIITFQMLWLNT